MKPKMFDELLQSVREGGALLRVRSKASRQFEIGSSGVREIRERTSLSQSEFALLIGVSVKTIQNWEQARRQPTGPAAALLRIIAHEPRLAVQAIHRT
jgi:DNA-binding transcriptional regulator YiaG